MRQVSEMGAWVIAHPLDEFLWTIQCSVHGLILVADADHVDSLLESHMREHVMADA